jgi:hypothetical protein
MCQKCLAFIQDYLEFPTSHKPHSSKKLSFLTRKIANELYRVLIKINHHHNMVKRVKGEYLNLVEKKIHVPTKPLELHLWEVALNYYNYMYTNKEKQKDLQSTVDLIVIELIEHGVFRQDAAKRWCLEKYFFILEHLKEIHDEHSGLKEADLNTIVFTKQEKISDAEIESWGNLYD